jgi:ankyrin repeat protein
VFARRPLHVEELAGFLAFKSEDGGSLTFEENWRPESPRDAVLFTYSSLIAVVNVDGSPVIQFSHFSVKEYLTSNRIAKGRVSSYYIPLESAHLFVAQVCLAFLIQLDEHVTKNSIEEFPLAQYAGQYWAEHAEFGDVSSHTADLMKRLFNPKSYHFKNWVWIYDTISYRSIRPESPSHPELVPLHYAARHGFHRVAEWLITAYSQDVNDSRYDSNTPIYIASEYGQFKMVQVLLKHHADVHIGGIGAWTPLHAASLSRNPKPEIARLLLEHGADMNSKTDIGITPLSLLSVQNGNLEVATVLLEHGADPNIRPGYGEGPLYVTLQKGHPGLVRLMLKHGADPIARDDYGQTLLHVASQRGDLKAAQGLVELGVDVNSQDNRGTTPLQVASWYGQKHIVQLLLQHGAEGT